MVSEPGLSGVGNAMYTRTTVPGRQLIEREPQLGTATEST